MAAMRRREDRSRPMAMQSAWSSRRSGKQASSHVACDWRKHCRCGWRVTRAAMGKWRSRCAPASSATAHARLTGSPSHIAAQLRADAKGAEPGEQATGSKSSFRSAAGRRNSINPAGWRPTRYRTEEAAAAVGSCGASPSRTFTAAGPSLRPCGATAAEKFVRALNALKNACLLRCRDLTATTAASF